MSEHGHIESTRAVWAQPPRLGRADRPEAARVVMPNFQASGERLTPDDARSLADALRAAADEADRLDDVLLQLLEEYSLRLNRLETEAAVVAG